MEDFRFPDLDTERLRLRRFLPTDLDFLFAHLRHPLVDLFLVDEEPVTTPEAAEAILSFFLQQDGKGYNRWLLTRKTDEQPLGTVGFHHWDRRNRHVEIGYDLSPQYWGNGYMREAAHAALDFAFTRMRVHRIEAMVHVENTRSIRLAEALGFEREGCLRGNFFRDGKYHDHYLYARLEAENSNLSWR